MASNPLQSDFSLTPWSLIDMGYYAQCCLVVSLHFFRKDFTTLHHFKLYTVYTVYAGATYVVNLVENRHSG